MELVEPKLIVAACEALSYRLLLQNFFFNMRNMFFCCYFAVISAVDPPCCHGAGGARADRGGRPGAHQGGPGCPGAQGVHSNLLQAGQVSVSNMLVTC